MFIILNIFNKLYIFNILNPGAVVRDFRALPLPDPPHRDSKLNIFNILNPGHFPIFKILDYLNFF